MSPRRNSLRPSEDGVPGCGALFASEGGSRDASP